MGAVAFSETHNEARSERSLPRPTSSHASTTFVARLPPHLVCPSPDHSLVPDIMLPITAGRHPYYYHSLPSCCALSVNIGGSLDAGCTLKGVAPARGVPPRC